MMHNTAYQTVSNKESISCNPNAIYGDVAHHICCLIPVYIDGGDCTACYYVDGRRDIIHKSIKTVLREIARHEGVLANGIARDSTTRGCSSKRHSINKTVKAHVYGSTNVRS